MPKSHLKFHSTAGKRRILLIEDEAINREIIGFMLQDSYDVTFAEDGGKALKILETEYQTLSMVLLDLILPDMRGTEILKRIRSERHTALLPIIVMTADQEAEVECLKLGATDFISKPYPRQEVVLARIQRTIELFEDRDIIRWTERDQLTGLYNREYFYRYAVQFDTFHPQVATDAIVLDINHFHMLNERYGREFGDRVLRCVADKLLKAVSDSDGIVSRRGGDTFLIYCPHRGDYADILEEACVDIGDGHHLRVRMGVYSNVDRALDVERRFDRAKQAADTVKNNYSKALGIYDDSMHEEELFFEQLLEDFHEAIRGKQFEVHYQPKFDIRSSEPALHSAEALVRWRHPVLGMVSPGIFIPLFEKNGLIRELDSYVWRETAAQIQKWKTELGYLIPVSINVSRIDLYDPQLLETLETITEEAGLDHADLLLEITESAYTENSEQIIGVVRTLREKGFHVEMDDFGTGYSSLNMITTLPIDSLKLDMQFIRTAFMGRKDTRLLEAVIGLAKSLELPTIAEGVETAEQLFTLKAMGCDIAQGYYFSKPLPAAEFAAFVREREISLAEPAEDVGGTTENGPRDKFTYDAMHDPLTGLYNHSAFNILFHDSDHQHIAVIIASLNDYRSLRAEKGRECADRTVKRVAEVLRNCFRSTDSICRLQEDEFVVIMSRITGSKKKMVFEKIEQINESLNKEEQGLPAVSLNVGVAFSDRADPQGNVFEDADAALRRTKSSRQIGYSVY